MFRGRAAWQSLGESGRRVYDAMRAVDATIRVDVQGADVSHMFTMNSPTTLAALGNLLGV